MASRQFERGQVVVAFVVLIPVLIMALFISLDLGRYQIMRNQVRIAADAAALSAAGALDIREATNGNFVLNETWAQQRAAEAVAAMQGRIDEDDWMTISLVSVRVDGAEVEVRVNGTASTLFGSFPVLPGPGDWRFQRERGVKGQGSDRDRHGVVIALSWKL